MKLGPYTFIDGRRRFRRVLRGFVSFVSSSLLLATLLVAVLPQDLHAADGISTRCLDRMTKLAENSRSGWVTEADFLRALRSERMRVAPMFSCPHCGRFANSADNEGKVVRCKGCGDTFDPVEAKVHREVVDEETGQQLIHILAMNLNSPQRAVVFAPRLVCGHCDTVSDHRESPEGRQENCVGCGSSLENADIARPQDGGPLYVRFDEHEPGGFTTYTKRTSPRDEWEAEYEMKGKRFRDRSFGDFIPSRQQLNPRNYSPRTWLGLGSGALVLGLGAWWIWGDHGPFLEDPEEDNGEVVGMHWSREIVIYEKDPATGELTFYTTIPESDDSLESLSKEWPTLPKEMRENTRRFRPEYVESYFVDVKIGRQIETIPVSVDEFRQWRYEDRVRLQRVNGEPTGIKRRGRR